ncbi:bifunctional serine/threonine-protein kinase/formylglycine-generating enzyme family protein [Engelhardtia mirabilis]|uniref:Serine/threonine-protein kinase PknD n=1 Tax=Engelhardtia mirabilis TaxID=2528011 RepID=A0A518BSM1_9BACT|nr:Serine/threonine-protein kinase PknD [Planctomycetes bacterium Pla133]QDV04298.1 Serine/threonine-protein kinase PknD [Planctomycetes bacterium Pla86]
MSTQGDPVQLSPAAELFAQYIERREAGEQPDFDALCGSHAELAPKLRAMYASWQLLSDAFDSELEQGRQREAASDQARADVRGLRREPPDSGRLTVRSELAHGGRGRILGVWDRDLRRELAMKVLIDSIDVDELAAKDPRTLARFLEEAQVTGQLEHPGIVPVHELGIDARGRVFFTMPLIRGDSFARVVERVHAGEWPRARALNVLLRVCEAVAYAHSRGVVHRDLKPSNVMVGQFGETYVIDWGLAQLGRRSEGHAPVQSTRRNHEHDSPLMTGAGDLVGTPAYMAPEQARGEIDAIGPPADVYAIGGMLYELLSGRAPFGHPGSTPEEIVGQVVEAAPRPLVEASRDVDPELVAICEHAMRREPSQRYASVIELSEDLRAYLEGRVVRAYRTGPVAELGKWVRRNRALAAAAGVAVVAVVAGLAVSLWLSLLAATRSHDVLRLSALRDVERLHAEARELWPPGPQLAERFADWVERARALVAETPAYRDDLAGLRAAAGADAHAPVYGPEAGRTAWWDEQLVRLIDELERLSQGLASDDGIDDEGWSIPKRLDFAEGLETLTLKGPEARQRWAEAATMAFERYDGLQLEPQLGLLPIGADPDSGLLEFWHPMSGAEPGRDAAGQIVPADEMGIVLVLLPGGTFLMGAQSEDPSAPGFDPQAVPNEGPPHEVTLEPFLMSKFETTQGQWISLFGENPSGYAAGEPSVSGPFTLRHPVETVSWNDSARFVRCCGLLLPTEAQWEYACGGGATTRFATGEDELSLEGHANLADEGSAPLWSVTFDYIEDFSDGRALTGPVGEQSPNGFGLFDMHGNVWEWVRDSPARYDKYPAAPGDGFRRSTAGRSTAHHRGGSYYTLGFSARVSYRGLADVDTIADDAGFRVSRALDRSSEADR